MEFSGEVVIRAARETVWRALNDPEVLKACIPGCEELAKTSDTEFVARVVSKVGPISARFAGKVALADIVPLQGYTIAGQGQGGVAGFAKGSAKVTLEDADGGTRLRYAAVAEIGGKLASLGSRMIQSVAAKMADEFFRGFARHIGGEVPATATTATTAPAPGPERIEPPANVAANDERIRWLLIGIAIGCATTLAGVLVR